MGAVELQKRDVAMLGSLLRWGVLPAWYLAAWYFDGSKRRAENRLGLLRRAGYLRRVETWWRGPLVVAPMERGRAARPDICLGTPETVESTRLKHRLEVVCVANHLLRADPQARWLTERQLRHAQVCDKCVANRRAWRRRPDGVLISGTRETAIEVETTTKPLKQYLAILDAYADQGVESHWYTVPTVAQERILQAAEVLDVHDLVHIWHWPPVTTRLEYARPGAADAAGRSYTRSAYVKEKRSGHRRVGNGDQQVPGVAHGHHEQQNDQHQ